VEDSTAAQQLAIPRAPMAASNLVVDDLDHMAHNRAMAGIILESYSCHMVADPA